MSQNNEAENQAQPRRMGQSMRANMSISVIDTMEGRILEGDRCDRLGDRHADDGP